jgi:CRP-like cAMP-binding protein
MNTDALAFLGGQAPLFAGVSAGDLAVLAADSALHHYGSGKTVLFKGSTVDGLHVVVTGRIAVFDKANPGSASVPIARLGPGEVFGEISIVEAGVSGATIKADGDSVVLVIPQEAFHALLRKDEGFAVRVNTLIRSRKPSADRPAPSAA